MEQRETCGGEFWEEPTTLPQSLSLPHPSGPSPVTVTDDCGRRLGVRSDPDLVWEDQRCGREISTRRTHRRSGGDGGEDMLERRMGLFRCSGALIALLMGQSSPLHVGRG